MTNQAAQTMPELPEPFDTVRVNEFSLQEAPVFSAGQMRAMYQQGYAAALSQTAGVPYGWLHAVEYVDGTCPPEFVKGADKPKGHLDQVDEKIRHIVAETFVADHFTPLYAAPAASGVHPDALPDGTLSKSTAKRVTALAAASVSERARAILSQAYRDAGFDKAAEWVLQVDLDNELYALDRAVLRAIEQALTQQWVCPACANVTESYCCACGWASVESTPQPSADAVRELVKRWRAKAKHHEIKGDRADVSADTSEWHKGMDEGVSDCADELESLLSAASGEKVVVGA